MAKKNKIQYVRFGVIIYIILLVIFILVLKNWGYPARYELVHSGPFSWSDIYTTLPQTLLLILLITIFVTAIYIQGEKIKQRELDAARKRIKDKGKTEFKYREMELDDNMADVFSGKDEDVHDRIDE
jgi:uncharacterized membrane protein